ncbi:MAG: hypothetical protein U5K53_01865 [Halanaerobiales bacterium]|nr:hypothetical protein [Halanaerobiales bacterium]
MEQFLDIISKNMNLDKLKKENEEIAKIREKRNVGEAGVPVYLILDDLTETKNDPIESGDSLFNLLLMISAVYYLDHLGCEEDDIDSDKFSLVLSALAEKYFYFLSYQSWK